jgi:hypothetical protein
MSTAQDHSRIAAELTDVFGPGAGSSITRFNNGVGTTSYTGAAGPQGSGGSQGSAGSPGLQAVNVAGQLFNANNLKNSLNDINHALANAETLEEIDAAIAKAGKVSKTDQRIGTLGDIATGVGYAGAAGKVLGGELGTGGSAALTGLKTAVPGVGMASGVGSLLGKYDLINPPLNKAAELVNELPGMEYFNRGLQDLGTGIRKIPGTGTASLIAGGLSEFPDEILSVPAKIWRSFGDKAKAAAKSSREFALNDMFEEYAKNDPYSTPPGGWVGTRTVPGGYGERQYNEEIPFQAETKDLWEEYKNTDSYKTVLTAQQGIRDLQEIRGQEALKKLQNDQAISELTDPVQSVVPVATHADLGIGTHYSDEYGTYDVETGEKIDVPSIYEPAAPILAPIPFEAPAAPEVEYQAPKQPKAVETAPTVRSDELNPLKRVRPEEVVTPRIMTPWRIRPQRETTAYEPFSSPEWQALDGSTPAVKPSYSKAQMTAMLGFNAPSRTASQYMALDARSTPKHNLRELTTGRNASSYKG